MKKTLFSLSLIALSFGAHAALADDRVELNQVTCTHWMDKNDDPTLSIQFKYKADSDFAKTTIRERFTSQYTNDPMWVVIHEADEQVASGTKSFSLGIDGVSIVIQRPVAKWNASKGPNGRLDMGNGTEVPLICEKRG